MNQNNETLKIKYNELNKNNFGASLKLLYYKQ